MPHRNIFKKILFCTDFSENADAAFLYALNIAEGNAKFSLKERARFFKIARASANECAAIFDAGNVLQIIDERTCQQSKSLLYRIVCMLSNMSK